jgi:predicted TIM-barrel fold metal-dependent hydrolase
MPDPAPTLVDVHAHFVTDEYTAAAKAAGHVYPDGMPGWPSWDPDSHLDLMDRCGIRASMLSISSPGIHFGDDKAARALARSVNEHGAAVAAANPGRFGRFACLPFPDVEGSLTELAYALDRLGSDGLAVETNSRGVYLGDERYDPIYAELDERRAVVFVHPTSPPHPEAVGLGRPLGMIEYIFDSARTVSDLVFSGTLSRYPDIRWIFTHGGGALPLLADRMYLSRPLFQSDVSGPRVQDHIRRLWFDLAGSPFPNQVPALVKAFGDEQLLFGSDHCWAPADFVVRHVASMDGAEQPEGETWRTLTTRNAARLLPRFSAAEA